MIQKEEIKPERKKEKEGDEKKKDSNGKPFFDDSWLYPYEGERQKEP